MFYRKSKNKQHCLYSCFKRVRCTQTHTQFQNIHLHIESTKKYQLIKKSVRTTTVYYVKVLLIGIIKNFGLWSNPILNVSR